MKHYKVPFGERTRYVPYRPLTQDTLDIGSGWMKQEYGRGAEKWSLEIAERQVKMDIASDLEEDLNIVITDNAIEIASMDSTPIDLWDYKCPWMSH